MIIKSNLFGVIYELGRKIELSIGSTYNLIHSYHM